MERRLLVIGSPNALHAFLDEMRAKNALALKQGVHMLRNTACPVCGKPYTHDTHPNGECLEAWAKFTTMLDTLVSRIDDIMAQSMRKRITSVSG